MTQLTFHHGGISVPSLDEAIAWYQQFLGFELERTFYIAPAKAKAAFVKRGTLRFEIFEVEGANALPDHRRTPNEDIMTHGNKHLAFSIDDLDTFLDGMTAKGADIAFIVRAAHGKGCFIRDCAGNLIEFVEEPVD